MRVQNDEQVKFLTPEVIKFDSKIEAMVDKGLSSSRTIRR